VRFPSKRKLEVENKELPADSEKTESSEECDSPDNSDAEESEDSSDASSDDDKTGSRTRSVPTGLSFNNEDDKDDELFVKKSCVELDEKDSSFVDVNTQMPNNKVVLYIFVGIGLILTYSE